MGVYGDMHEGSVITTTPDAYTGCNVKSAFKLRLPHH
jgi:hypothetical protein